MAIEAGQDLLHYRLIEKIGEGGMGVVWKADDKKLHRQVAVKVVPEAAASDPQRRARFEREARTLASLNHPHVVTIHALEEAETSEGSAHFIAMECVHGTLLRALVSEGGLALSRLLELALPLTDAVACAHQAGITHRDLKPDNIIIDLEGRLRVLDFGLAAFAASDATTDTEEMVTRESVALTGTPPYMAPEQLEHAASTPSVDVFALGAILYEMASGSLAFGRRSVAATVAAVLSEEPRPLEDLRPDLPAAFVRLVHRCLRKDPRRRVQTVRDIHNELMDLEETRVEGAPVLASGEAVRGTIERVFPLTVDTVRGLADRSPSMIGDTMSYLDNGLESDVLAIYLGGLGLDETMFASALARASHRAIAVSLYGFGPNARRRPALSFEDHTHLLRALFCELERKFRPSHQVLVGFSAGADHALRMAASSERFGIRVDGLLALGPNVNRATCMYSRSFLRLPDPGKGNLVPIIKELGQEMEDLPTWLILHDYLVQVFRKFGEDARPLRRYARDLVAPFDMDGEPFVDWYRAAVAEVPELRVVFTRQEEPFVEALLSRHLDENLLGPDYREETIVTRSDLDHLELAGPALLESEVASLIEIVKSR